MKKRVAAFLMAATLAVSAGPQLVVVPPNGHCRLTWSYDTNLLSTNLFFNIYSSTNLSIPVDQWPLFTNVVGTNLTIDIDIVPGPNYFVAAASNFWGESSIDSTIGGTPALPVSMNNTIKIQKLP